jgi:hypothetical protein
MAEIRSVRCGSWAQFTRDLYGELFSGEAFEEERYLFRGVGSDEWHLESSFDRDARHVPPEHRGDEAAELLRLFKEECEASDGAAGRYPANWHAQIALAQHYSLPTRALDWTESPYVAGYFAFADAYAFGRADERGHVAVWALDRRHAAWEGENGVEIVTAGRRGNERMIRQRAALTYLNAAATALDEYALEHPEPGNALVRFSLPKSEARVALADLAAMGITSTRLFPDREGAARAARVRYAIRRAVRA